MKRIITLLTIFLLTSTIGAQVYKNGTNKYVAYRQSYGINLNAVVKSNYEGMAKGDNVVLTKLMCEECLDPNIGLKLLYTVKIGDKEIKVKNKIEKKLDFQYKDVQDIWDSEIICNVLYELGKYGIQEKMRLEMEEDALEYIYKVRSSGLEFKDPYLENYIYGLIAQIAPSTFIDGRPCSINIVIIDDPSMNAGMFPNGTLSINTGLIAGLHTEDELVAVLSHEIAHFVLDHSVQNINKVKERKKRAEFWAALATGVVAVTEGVAAATSSYYIPGAATMATAAMASSIANEVIEHLGMDYYHEQENEADELSQKVLQCTGRDINALANAFARMKENMKRERSSMMYFNSFSHPALVNRIEKIGNPDLSIKDKEFEKMVSFAVSSAARMKYEDRRFGQVLPLVTQNIDNGVATTIDYILKANCLLALKNDENSNKEALSYVNKAKEIDPTNINIYKTEILVTLRLGKKDEALSLLKGYKEKLSNGYENYKDLIGSKFWESYFNFATEEIDWSNRMILKLGGMNL